MMRSMACCLFAAAVLAGSALAQAKAKAQNVPENPYESFPNYLKMMPGLYMGEAMGMATNSKGHLFVYTRSATTASNSPARSAPIPRTTSGWSTKAPTW